jgi:hypothetical protein
MYYIAVVIQTWLALFKGSGRVDVLQLPEDVNICNFTNILSSSL